MTSLTENERKNIPLIIVAGPTASGKTSVALKLARLFNGEIVGADSMQIYRKMNIGTATPTAEELDGIKHHMLDIVNPDEEYDGARFVADADRVIEDITKRGKRVIIAGGTGMYIRLLLKGMHNAPAPDPDIRAELLKKANNLGWPELHKELVQKDKISGEKLHPNDGVRIIRALEVLYQTGIPMSQWQKEHNFAISRYKFKMLGVLRDKEILNERINFRVKQMMKDGFVEEVNNLLHGGYSKDLKPMQALGYKRVVQYINGEMNLEEAIIDTMTDTRRFAKRQRTWFRKEPVTWLDSEEDFIIETENFFKDQITS
jgi:tRNA dimethylallyltransferase